MLWAHAIIGLRGYLAGALFAWALAFPCLMLAVLRLVSKGGPTNVRAAVWGVTTAVGPATAGYAYLGQWGHAALGLACLICYVALDYATRNRGPWDRVSSWLDRWVTARASRIVGVAASFGVAYPAFVGLLLRERNMQFLHDAMTHALSAGHPARLEVVGFVVAATLGALTFLAAFMALFGHPRRLDQPTRAALLGLGGVPIVVWTVAAGFLPVDIAVVGVAVAGLLSLTTCAEAFIA
jgi:hypothetical protein